MESMLLIQIKVLRHLISKNQLPLHQFGSTVILMEIQDCKNDLMR